ncbi:MAG: M48 family metallopeptidase [Chloroflexota bacterium]
MIRLLGLVALVLGIPAFGVVAASVVERRAAMTAIATAEAAALQKRDIFQIYDDAACATGFQAGFICDPSGLATVLRLGAALSVVLGMVMILTIASMGLLGRLHRLVLLASYAPLLHLVRAAAVVLLLMHAALIVMSTLALQIGVSGAGHSILVVGITAATIWGAAYAIRAALWQPKRPDNRRCALGLVPEDHPRLWQLVNEVAEVVGVRPPKFILAGMSEGFWVTESRVKCLNGTSRGRVLHLSLPWCRLLTVSELKAVIGHELGHFKGSDRWFSRLFFPVYSRSAETYAAMSQASEVGTLEGISLMPSVGLWGFFIDCFRKATADLAQRRELAADELGAAAATPAACASALARLHLFGGIWKQCEAVAGNAAMARQNSIPNYCDEYVRRVGEANLAQAIDKAATSVVAHPTDSHPPLSIRLEALGSSLSEVAASDPRHLDGEPSTALFGELSSLETELSEALRVHVRPDWRK